jgi:phosphoribosylaminoimidazole-succinocarboxamide synthase
MASALTFLERYHKDGDEFLNHIVRVTGDGTWVSFVNVETEKESKQWIPTRLYTNRATLEPIIPEPDYNIKQVNVSTVGCAMTLQQIKRYSRTLLAVLHEYNTAK